MIDNFLKSLEDYVQKKFGRKKPYALSVDGWNEFDKKYKEEEPIRFFFCETVPEKILYGYRKAIGWKLRKFREFFYYRFMDKYHVVKTDLAPGYYDKDSLLFHANFSILVDYVESELAWMYLINNSSNEGDVLFEKYKRQWKLANIDPTHLLKINFKSSELGIAFLENYVEKNPYDTEDDEGYAETIKRQQNEYKEILDIYTWYTKTYPEKLERAHKSLEFENREELEKKYGFMFILSSEFRKENPDVYKRYQDDSKVRQQLKEEIEKESTDMLIRLITIRSRLWT